MLLQSKINEIREKWSKLSLPIPTGLVAVDIIGGEYIVASDNKPIVSLISVSTLRVSVIPKKYLELDDFGVYKITQPPKLTIISCKKKSVNIEDKEALKILRSVLFKSKSKNK